MAFKSLTFRTPIGNAIRFVSIQSTFESVFCSMVTPKGIVLRIRMGEGASPITKLLRNLCEHEAFGIEVKISAMLVGLPLTFGLAEPMILGVVPHTLIRICNRELKVDIGDLVKCGGNHRFRVTKMDTMVEVTPGAAGKVYPRSWLCPHESVEEPACSAFGGYESYAAISASRAPSSVPERVPE
jgi:hypothetical protein